MADQYADRPQVCPNCGNHVGFTDDTTYCITDPEPDGAGCGWLQVHRPEPNTG